MFLFFLKNQLNHSFLMCRSYVLIEYDCTRDRKREVGRDHLFHSDHPPAMLFANSWYFFSPAAFQCTCSHPCNTFLTNDSKWWHLYRNVQLCLAYFKIGFFFFLKKISAYWFLPKTNENLNKILWSTEKLHILGWVQSSSCYMHYNKKLNLHLGCLRIGVYNSSRSKQMTERSYREVIGTVSLQDREYGI